MRVIIDAYRGGNDVGKSIDGKYEKNILLDVSKYMKEELNKLGIDVELVRDSDMSLSDDDRNSIINEIKSDNDIIIQNRLSEDNEFNIIYSLRQTDKLASLISTNLEIGNILVNKYFQRRLPSNTMLDYYSIQRNTKPNEAIIIEYKDINNYKDIVSIIADSIYEYIDKESTYVVVSGDTLYGIAKKNNTSVDEIKELNSLTSNNLEVGQILIIPTKKENKPKENDNTYIVQKGDTLYGIANKYGITVNDLKNINNLTSNSLNVNQVLYLPKESKPINEKSEGGTTINNNTYIVQKGDTLYGIANKYGVSVADIKNLNNLTSNNLSINQILLIPSKNDFIKYIVQKGDTLYGIANKYNITINDLKSINNLTSNNLSIGMELKIPK